MKEVGRYLRDNVGAIRAQWLGEVRLSCREPAGVLMDHIPELVERMVRCLEVGDIDADDGRESTALPAQVAYAVGTPEVVAEYRILRRVVLEFAARSPGVSPDAGARFPGLALLNQALDDAISAGVDDRPSTPEPTRAEPPAEQATLDDLIAQSAQRMTCLVDELVELTRSRPEAEITFAPRALDLVVAAGEA